MGHINCAWCAKRVKGSKRKATEPAFWQKILVYQQHTGKPFLMTDIFHPHCMLPIFNFVPPQVQHIPLVDESDAETTHVMNIDTRFDMETLVQTIANKVVESEIKFMVEVIADVNHKANERLFRELWSEYLSRETTDSLAMARKLENALKADFENVPNRSNEYLSFVTPRLPNREKLVEEIAGKNWKVNFPWALNHPCINKTIGGNRKVLKWIADVSTQKKRMKELLGDDVEILTGWSFGM